MVNCMKVAGISMRVAVAFFLGIGIGLIVLACQIQNPPKAWAPVCMVLLGVLNLLAALLGFFGSYNKKRMLLFFLVLGGVSILFQTGLVLGLLLAFDSTVNAIAPGLPHPPPPPPPSPFPPSPFPPPSPDPALLLPNMPPVPPSPMPPPPPPGPPPSPPMPYQDVKHNDVASTLNVARWVALGFIFFEILTLVMAILIKYVLKEEAPYDPFDERNQEQRSLALSSLRSDIEKTSGKSKVDSTYNKIRSKMAQKYGQFSQGSDWKSKTKFSWK